VAGLAIFLLSAATLTFEITLTRLFSVSQFYHFAFMIVSIALLGTGASGTMLAIVPAWVKKYTSGLIVWLALLTGASICGAYLLTNWLPFDSFMLAFDMRQVFVLILHYVALSLPFFFCGLVVSLVLSSQPDRAGKTYAANLSGSAFGCILALVGPTYLGGEAMVALASLSAGLASLFVYLGSSSRPKRASAPHQISRTKSQTISGILISVLLIFTFSIIRFRLAGKTLYQGFNLVLSPYKSISYALRYPDAQVIFQRWNSISRVDVVRSSGIHSIPGLSYRYLGTLPSQDGLFVDGDDLNPVINQKQSVLQSDLAFTEYLPSRIAYSLRPQARVLMLEPRGGLDIITALTQGASQVTAVEANALIIEAARGVYQDERVKVINEADRSYLNSSKDRFDIIVLALTASYHPVRSGAYSLAEDYRYTVESFQEILEHLKPGGFFVVTRWLQSPPSECLRTFALAVTALERMGAVPKEQIVAFRGYNTITTLVKNGIFNEQELADIRLFLSTRAFDLVYAPGVSSDETNLYNILPVDVYNQEFTRLLDTHPYTRFYDNYPFDVSPPTDDRPFFNHFFKWSQAPQILAEFGKTWQPFGGAGYFIILGLLLLSVFLALILVLLPVFITSRKVFKDNREQIKLASTLPVLFYFTLIGFAFLLVEIPLIQRFILYLGNPAYAMCTVLFALLLFSSFGSRISHRIPFKLGIGLLVILQAIFLWGLPVLFRTTIGWSLTSRLVVSVLVLAPLGFLMGIPFPGGVRWLVEEEHALSLIPWIWGVNGAASVVSAVLAALLVLSLGFTRVGIIGTVCYLFSLVTVLVASYFHPVGYPHQ